MPQTCPPLPLSGRVGWEKLEPSVSSFTKMATLVALLTSIPASMCTHSQKYFVLRSTHTYMSTCSCKADFLQRVSLLTLAKTAMQMHVHPPTTTLVSMGADMIGDESAADMPPLPLSGRVWLEKLEPDKTHSPKLLHL